MGWVCASSMMGVGLKGIMERDRDTPCVSFWNRLLEKVPLSFCDG